MTLKLGMLGCLVLASSCSLAEVKYKLTDLGTLGTAGYQSFAYGINDSGQVVGYSGLEFQGNAVEHAFLHSGGAMTDLGTLGGARSWAMDINSNGKVVGWSNASGGEARAVVWGPQGIQMLDLPYGQFSGATAYSINSSGKVGGSLGDLYYHTTVGSSGFICDSDPSAGNAQTFGYFSQVSGINDQGVGAGWAHTIDGITHAYAFDGSTATDLGTLGGLTSVGRAINASGQIVGFAQTTFDGNPNHAFLYSGGTMSDLGTLGGPKSFGYAVNDFGAVVGIADRNNGAGLHPFVFDGTQMLDLNDLIDPTLGWELTEARDINNSGQIVGWGLNGSSNARAYLLTPVPEPATALALLTGLALLIRTRRRRT